MVRHIVVFKLVSTGSEQASVDAERVRAALLPLVDTVPHVDHIEVGTDLGTVDFHWDLVLVSHHGSEQELAAYQQHPDHVAAVAAINPLIEARAIVDYLVD